jgi:hypothetical protein
MVLGEVEESVTTREIDEETEEEIVKVKEKIVVLLLKLTQCFLIFCCVKKIISIFLDC